MSASRVLVSCQMTLASSPSNAIPHGALVAIPLLNVARTRKGTKAVM